MRLVVILCFFPFFSACASVPYIPLKFSPDMKNVLSSTLHAKSGQTTSLVGQQVRIFRSGQKLEMRSLFILKRGKDRGEFFPVRVRKNTQLSLYVITKKGSTPLPVATYGRKHVDGKLMVTVPLEDFPAGSLLVVAKKVVLGVRKELFFNFYPAISSQTLYASLEVDIKRPLYYRVSSKLRRSLAFRKNGTKYRWVFEEGDGTTSGLAQLHISTLPTKFDFVQFVATQYRKYLAKVSADISPYRLLRGIKGDKARLSYLHEYYLAQAISLEPGLIPDKNGKYRRAADYCANMMRALRRLKYNCKLVIPYTVVEGQVTPIVRPGVVVKVAGKRHWFFPFSRFASIGDIPQLLRGKRCLLLSLQGETSRGIIPRSPAKQDRTQIYANIYLKRDGSCYLYVTALFSGAPARYWRTVVNSGDRVTGMTAFIRNFFPDNFSFSTRRFKVKHRRVLRHRLRVSFSGKLYGAVLRRGRNYRFDLSLLKNLLRSKRGIWREASEHIRLYLPHGSRYVRMPRSRLFRRRGVYVRQRFRYFRGKRIRKPRRWSWRLWRKWKRYNIAKRKDRVVYTIRCVQRSANRYPLIAFRANRALVLGSHSWVLRWRSR